LVQLTEERRAPLVVRSKRLRSQGARSKAAEALDSHYPSQRHTPHFAGWKAFIEAQKVAYKFIQSILKVKRKMQIFLSFNET